MRRFYSTVASKIINGAPKSIIPEDIRGTIKWKPGTIRAGVVGIKKGMTSLWDHWGVNHAVTVVQLDRCQVIQTHLDSRNGLLHCDVGGGYRNPANWKYPQRKMLQSLEIKSKKRIFGFEITENASLASGTPIYAAHFVPGQLVDVQGISIGKGFQGVMKRWNFKGGPASHGCTKNHRGAGSVGSRSEPGKVLKGKKMAGRMGGKKVTVARLKGAVPGHDESILRIKDSRYNPIFKTTPPPMPTFVPHATPLPREIVAKSDEKDPLKIVLTVE